MTHLCSFKVTHTKNTMVYKERVKLQFRFEMINAFNRVWFGGLDTNVTSPTYTKLTSQANQPRNIQLGLKLSFCNLGSRADPSGPLRA